MLYAVLKELDKRREEKRRKDENQFVAINGATKHCEWKFSSSRSKRSCNDMQVYHQYIDVEINPEILVAPLIRQSSRGPISVRP